MRRLLLPVALALTCGMVGCTRSDPDTADKPTRSPGATPSAPTSVAAATGPDGCRTDPADPTYDYCLVHAAPPPSPVRVALYPPQARVRPGERFRVVVESDCGEGLVDVQLLMPGQKPHALTMVEAGRGTVGGAFRFYASGILPEGATPGSATLDATAACGRAEDLGSDSLVLPVAG